VVYTQDDLIQFAQVFIFLQIARSIALMGAYICFEHDCIWS